MRIPHDHILVSEGLSKTHPERGREFIEAVSLTLVSVVNAHSGGRIFTEDPLASGLSMVRL